MNKREFMLAGGGALVAGSAWAELTDADRTDPTGLQAWQRRLGERLAVVGAAVPTALVLRDVKVHAGAGPLQQFTLVFERHGMALAAGTRLLQPANGTALALYLDAAGTDATRQPLMRAHFCHCG
jgi:hypothetical protein